MRIQYIICTTVPVTTLLPVTGIFNGERLAIGPRLRNFPARSARRSSGGPMCANLLVVQVNLH